MSWGTLRLGRIELRETPRATSAVNAQTGEQSFTVEGTETAVATDAARDILRGIEGGGSIRTYLSLPANVDPRWGCDPTGYLSGAASIRIGGVERAGTNILVSGTTGWELSNGLVRVRPLAASGLLSIDAWDNPAWSNKGWDIYLNGVAMTPADLSALTVLRNDPEAVTIRLVRTPSSNSGRTYVDLLLRRGSRFVEAYVQHETSTTILIRLNTTTASTAGTGHVVQTANDADGNRAIIGSARTFTADTVNGGLSKAATSTLDAFIGVVFGGGAPASGDAAADLTNQYIGAMAEATVGVLR